MRKYLTIGEISKLLNISAYNIRYYEKEGLIQPSQMSESGYRLYDYEDVYLLSGIKVLRDSNIPIKQIKELVANHTKDNYYAAIKDSYIKVSAEIEKLTKLKARLEKTLDFVAHTDVTKRIFTIKTFGARIFKVLKTSGYNMDYSVKEMYDLFVENEIDMSSIYRSDMHYFLRDTCIEFCVRDDNDAYHLPSIKLGGGQYLTYLFFDDIDKDGVLEKRTNEMIAYMRKNKMPADGGMLLEFGIKTLMVADTQVGGELQIKLK